MLETGKEVGGITFGRKRELRGEDQWCAKDGFSRRKIGGVMRRGAIGKENPG